MKKTEKPMYLNLQLFADGAGASGAGTGTGDGGTGTTGAKGETATAAVSQQGVKGKNSLADVKYGIQTKEATPEAQAPDVQKNVKDGAKTTDRQADFENLIKGEYKDLYDAKVQNIVKERLRVSKETADKFEALTPTLDLLSKKYGVDSADIEALNKAIESDDSYWEDEAIKRGMSVQQLKEMRKMERENSELRRVVEEKKTQDKARQDLSRWIQQSEQVKQIYPSFDLRTEMENPQFLSLLRNYIDPKTAYEVIHKDEIIRGAMQYTAKTVEEKTVNKIMANGVRPVENGNASQGGSMTKADVSQLTKADREEIARRVARGEKISFG